MNHEDDRIHPSSHRWSRSRISGLSTTFRDRHNVYMVVYATGVIHHGAFDETNLLIDIYSYDSDRDIFPRFA